MKNTQESPIQNTIDFVLRGKQCPTESDISNLVAGIEKPITDRDTAMSIATAIVCIGRNPSGVKTALRLLAQYSSPALFQGEALTTFFGVSYRWAKLIGPRPNFGSHMERLFDVLNEYKKEGAQWYLTINGNPRECVTISTDNWAYLLACALDSKHRDSKPIAVVIRKFEQLRDATTGLPLKTIGGLCVFNNEVRPLSASEIEEASTTDNKTGLPLAKEKHVRFMDIQKLIPKMFT